MKIWFSGTQRCSFGKKCKGVSEKLTSSIFRVGESDFSTTFVSTVLGESENSQAQRNTGSTEVIFQDLNCIPSVSQYERRSGDKLLWGEMKGKQVNEIMSENCK